MGPPWLKSNVSPQTNDVSSQTNYFFLTPSVGAGSVAPPSISLKRPFDSSRKGRPSGSEVTPRMPGGHPEWTARLRRSGRLKEAVSRDGGDGRAVTGSAVTRRKRCPTWSPPATLHGASRARLRPINRKERRASDVPSESEPRRWSAPGRAPREGSHFRRKC